jgi:hypothetical protein
VVQRYGSEGIIAFSVLDYFVACRGVGVMNDLAYATDVATAQEAAMWSELLAEALRAGTHTSPAEAMARGLAVAGGQRAA